MNTLVILAGGMSSRMKKSAENAENNNQVAAQAKNRSKSLIEVGKSRRPLMDYMLFNARQAGISKVVILTSKTNNSMFKEYYGEKDKDNEFNGLSISYAIQHIPADREKPLGTADAVYQSICQYPDLNNEEFVVCNSDNLYSRKAIELLKQCPCKNAWINYDRQGLEFSIERIAAFAITAVDNDNQLKKIIEKPKPEDAEKFKDKDGVVRVSMNIFKFSGPAMFSYFENCPLHPTRNEKELQTAIMNFVQENPGNFEGIPLTEHVPDLTTTSDIEAMQDFLLNRTETPDWIQ